ncbi:MAG: pyridoxal phosphate-dependent aminotransferase [Candidatus Ranarchaeia archaeon]|jgi:aminotransferase
MKISRNAETIPPSGTMQMKEIATSVESTGKKVIHLEVGEPDFPTPQAIIDELCKAANAGNTKYTSARGIPELREAISESLSQKNISYSADQEIIATPGSKHALFMGMQALLNPGDEIIILTPAWPTYMAIPLALGAKPVETPLTNKLQIDEECVKANISGKTKVLLLNSPSNPTGKGFSETEMKFLADIAIDRDLSVISDEVYGHITYDGYKHLSPSSLPGMLERTLLIDAFSKTYSMTGWRLGWGAGPKSLIAAMVKLQQASTSCPAAMVQKAGVFALRDSGVAKYVNNMVQEYRKRQAYLVPALNKIPNVICDSTQGAFYVFPEYTAPKTPSKELALQLLKEKGVSMTAGSEFGDAGENHLRLSFASSMSDLEEGVQLLSEFFSKY